MATVSQGKLSSTQLRLYVDLVLFSTYVLVNIPQATGLGIHEWASVLFIVPMLIHIVLDWQWIVSVTKRVLGKLPGEVRTNHTLDLIIFVTMVLALFTGFLVSEAVLPALGMTIAIDPFWSSMHDLMANLTMVLIGIHLAMHWGWISKSIKRYLLRHT